MESLQEAKQFSPMSDPNYDSAYDLYVEGKSYPEIAKILGIDIFEAMNQVARESMIYAAQTRDNPQINYAFAIDQLKKVIKTAWDRDGDLWGKESSYDGLPVIVNASKQLISLTKQLALIAQDEKDDDESEVPEQVDRRTLRAIGKEQVRSLFPKPRAV